MPFPDRVLLPDEVVVGHVTLHWRTLVRPVGCLFVVVGGASFCAAAVPGGPRQTLVRLVVLGAALALLLRLVAGPVLRWWTTHRVLTDHRLLVREGVLGRRGRSLAWSQVAEVAFRQTRGERLLRSGSVVVRSAGEPEPLVLDDVPDIEAVQRLVQQLVDEAHAGWPDAADEGAGAGWAPAFCD